MVLEVSAQAWCMQKFLRSLAYCWHCGAAKVFRSGVLRFWWSDVIKQVQKLAAKLEEFLYKLLFGFLYDVRMLVFQVWKDLHEVSCSVDEGGNIGMGRLCLLQYFICGRYSEKLYNGLDFLVLRPSDCDVALLVLLEV